MASIVMAVLYKFVTLGDYVAPHEPLLQTLLDNGMKGTLLLAEEGINGTVSGSREGTDALFAWLRSDPRLADIEHKESYCDEQPFYRTKVKLKKEIVTLGVPGVDPNKQVGQYAGAKDWNVLISDPEVLLIGTRNGYEVTIGTLEGVVDPKTRSFREFPEYIKVYYNPARHKKAAMFCTGGTRCEKAFSHMLGAGFEEVFHLRDGILKYLEEMPQEQNLWHGDRFIFDNRVTMRHDLSEGEYDRCHACRNPVSLGNRQSEHYVPGISCSHRWDSSSEKTRAGARERQKQIELAWQRNQSHPLGRDPRQSTPENWTLAKARLLHVMGPMCFWCWGFAPVVKALSRRAAADGVAFYLVAGDLRTGYGAALDPSARGHVLGYWRTVQQTTSQPFCFDDALPEDSVYDTELACRALVAVRSPDEEGAWPLARVIQRAFYAEGRDITQVAVFADLAEAVGTPRIEFAAVLDSGKTRGATAANFAWVQDLGIAGLLTLLAERNGQLASLTNGYQPLAELSPLPGRWLERGRYE